MRKTATALFLTLALSACGSDGGKQTTPSTSSVIQSGQSKSASPNTKPKSDGKTPASRPRAPINLSDPRVAALTRNFPPPTPAPGAKNLSVKAIAKGRRACKGKMPFEVKAVYYGKAKANLDPEQRQMIGELPKYEAEASEDASFIAGQLAATVYGATLPEAEFSYGFEGCVYELSRVLAGQISEEE